MKSICYREDVLPTVEQLLCSHTLDSYKNGENEEDAHDCDWRGICTFMHCMHQYDCALHNSPGIYHVSYY